MERIGYFIGPHNSRLNPFKKIHILIEVSKRLLEFHFGP